MLLLLLLLLRYDGDELPKTEAPVVNGLDWIEVNDGHSFVPVEPSERMPSCLTPRDCCCLSLTYKKLLLLGRKDEVVVAEVEEPQQPATVFGADRW